MQIIFHRKFEKKFVKLSQKIKESFKKRIELFLKDPSHPQLNNHPLAGDRNSEWSINVTGDLRAIYVWISPDKVVFIDIDTHSNLYQ